MAEYLYDATTKGESEMISALDDLEDGFLFTLSDTGSVKLQTQFLRVFRATHAFVEGEADEDFAKMQDSLLDYVEVCQEMGVLSGG